MLCLTRREILAATASAALSSSTASAQGRTAKPNIVYIMADDLGYADLSCYGRREYRTSNIDSIASNGMKFLQAYANSAVCSATRTALITGRYQYRLRVGPRGTASTHKRRLWLASRASDLAIVTEEGRLRNHSAGEMALGATAKLWPAEKRLRSFLGVSRRRARLLH